MSKGSVERCRLRAGRGGAGSIGGKRTALAFDGWRISHAEVRRTTAIPLRNGDGGGSPERSSQRREGVLVAALGVRTGGGESGVGQPEGARDASC